VKTLVVEDDFISRLLLQEILKGFGTVHIAVNGKEAVEAVRAALASHQAYDLICLDVMMPVMDGQAALKEIRALEAEASASSPHRARIVMTTGVSDGESVKQALGEHCDGYLLKPVDKPRLLNDLRKLGLIR
jgi:two-component system chemotaxis response regulator CheY